jgi:acylphosphatase
MTEDGSAKRAARGSAQRVARLVLVSGRVQGVGFRYATRDAAIRLGMTGYARNLVDDRVEVFVDGDAQSVEAMVEWLRGGPPTASVTDLEVREAEPGEFEDFTVR